VRACVDENESHYRPTLDENNYHLYYQIYLIMNIIWIVNDMLKEKALTNISKGLYKYNLIKRLGYRYHTG
jgi:hypothetical protein